MVRRYIRAAVLLGAALAGGCRTDYGPADPALAARIPDDAIVVAGVRVEALGATPVGRRLAEAGWLSPQGVEARDLLVSWDGAQWLAAARTRGGEITVIGPETAGGNPPRALFERAHAVPRESHLWAVSYGAPSVPSGGRFTGIDRLINAVEDITVWADLSAGIRAEASGNCRDERNAEIVEETVRGFIGLGRAVAGRRDPELARAYDAIRVERNGRAVRLEAALPQDAALKLLDSFIAR